MAIYTFDQALKKNGVTKKDVTSVGVSPQDTTKAGDTSTISSRLKDTFQGAGEEYRSAVLGEGEYAGQSPVRRGLSAAATAFNTIPKAAYDVLPEQGRKVIDKTGEVIGKGFNYATDKISDTDLFSELGRLNAEGHLTSEGYANIEGFLSSTGSLGGIAGNIIPPVGAGGAGKAISTTARTVATNTAKAAEDVIAGASRSATNLVGDIIPTADRVVNHQVAKALDLTAGDVKNLRMSTGNEVGEFMAKNDLIKNNKPTTLKALEEFSKDNYRIVREEISKVDKVYSPDDVPRYKLSLNELKKQVSEIPGQEAKLSKIDDLLAKKEIKLTDVQASKELMDNILSLFKNNGDVKEGILKTGFSNIRKDLKQFIEKEVKDTTGSDISDLNNKVQTAKGILETTDMRSGRGLTRSTLSLGDMSIFGAGSVAGSPLFGGALLLAKRIAETPTMQLRAAKIFDRLSSRQKINVKKSLENGIVPKELQSLDSSPSRSTLSKKFSNDTTIENSSVDTIKNKDLNNSLINQNIKTNNANKTATVNNKSNRTIDTSIPQAGMLSKLKDKYKKSWLSNQGGYVGIGKKQEANNLIKEAKKYKSAEEFVKGQKPIFHGTNADFEKFDLSRPTRGVFGKAVYLGTDKNVAGYYGSKIKEFYTPNSKILDIGDIESKKKYFDLAKKLYKDKTGKELADFRDRLGYSNNIDDLRVFWRENTDSQIGEAKKYLTDYWKNKGYDGVKEVDTVAIFDPEVLKTKSQLTEIWNKANNPGVGKKSVDKFTAKRHPYSIYRDMESYIDTFISGEKKISKTNALDLIEYMEKTGIKLPKRESDLVKLFDEILKKAKI